MVNFSALKIEIALPAYSGMDDATIAANINGQNVATLREFNPMEVIKILVRNGDMGWLLGVKTGYVTGTNAANASGAGGVTVPTTAPWQIRRTAETLVWLLERPWSVDTSEQVTVDGLAAAMNILVAANVVTAASRTAIQAATIYNRKGWEKFGTDMLDYNHIVLARAAP